MDSEVRNSLFTLLREVNDAGVMKDSQLRDCIDELDEQIFTTRREPAADAVDYDRLGSLLRMEYARGYQDAKKEGQIHTLSATSINESVYPAAVGTSTDAVDRVVVVTTNGRVFDQKGLYDSGAVLDVQDEGRTLKVLPSGSFDAEYYKENQLKRITYRHVLDLETNKTVQIISVDGNDVDLEDWKTPLHAIMYDADGGDNSARKDESFLFGSKAFDQAFTSNLMGSSSESDRDFLFGVLGPHKMTILVKDVLQNLYYRSQHELESPNTSKEQVKADIRSIADDLHAALMAVADEF